MMHDSLEQKVFIIKYISHYEDIFHTSLDILSIIMGSKIYVQCRVEKFKDDTACPRYHSALSASSDCLCIHNTTLY